MNKKLWGYGFLGITAAALGLEFLASFDNDANTLAWTEYIIEYIPMDLTFLAIGGLFGWLIVHFWKGYKK